jgi:hypothetical protein
MNARLCDCALSHAADEAVAVYAASAFSVAAIDVSEAAPRQARPARRHGAVDDVGVPSGSDECDTA